MESRSTKWLVILLSAVVLILSALDIIIISTSPWWLHTLYKSDFAGLKLMLGYNYTMSSVIYPLMLTFFIISGLLCLGILAAAFRILGRIRHNSPFCIGNAMSLRNASICSFGLFIVFIIKMFFSPSILTLVCGGMFLLFSLFVLVMSQLVRVAAGIKEENDLTI
ncbi:MAG TPA: DUF2975 domain-containing protein [Ruminiclostridium sp.]|nr:DUF2975 domain-containing protein [Ruminiclostridium sp.]